MELKKLSTETLKDLKIKIKERGEKCLSSYNREKFNPKDLLAVTPTSLGFPEISEEVVEKMCDSLSKDPTEFSAGKILYENLKFLTPKEASDIGFWSYLNHFPFYPYLAQRWEALWKKDTNVENYILDHWVQTNSSQSSLIRYSLSGLWWSFYLTVDEENETDKYLFTKTFFKNETLRTRTLGTAKFARHKPAINAVLEFLQENNLEDSSLEDAGRAIVPYINLLGGIRPLTYFKKDWFKQKLLTRFKDNIEVGKKLYHQEI